jgi:hypothetical protein
MLTHAAPADRLNLIAHAVKAAPQCRHELDVEFTPGMMRRTCRMFAGSFIVSKIHNTCHQWVVTKGRARVWTPTEGVIDVVAPAFGVTAAGTQRLLFILEDTEWTTFHPTDKTTIEEVEADIIDPQPPLPESLNEGIKCLGFTQE